MNMNLKDPEVRFVIDSFRRADDDKDIYNQDWINYYKDYMGHEDGLDSVPDWRAKVFIPVVASVIETILPRLINSTVNNRPLISILPREMNDEEGADILEQIVDYQLGSRMDFSPKFYELCKNMLLYGSGLFKVSWKYLERDIPTWVEKPVFDEETGRQVATEQVKEKRPTVMYDAPDLEVVDPFNFYPDPQATNLKDARFVVYQYYTSMENLKDLEKQGIASNVDKIKDFQEADEDDAEYENQKRLVRGLSGDFGNIDGYKSESNSRGIEIKEYWGAIPGDFLEDGEEGTEEEGYIMVANDNVLVAVNRNPFDHQMKPFIKLDNYPMPGEFWGKSEVSFLHDLQSEINTVRRQRLDAKNLMLKPVMKISRQAGIRTKDLRNCIRAGGTLWMNGDVREGIERLDFGGIDVSGYNESQALFNDVDRISGTYDFTRGNPNTSMNETASGVMTVVKEANARFSLKITQIYHFMKRLGIFLVELNQQYTDGEKAIRIVGKEGQEWMQYARDSIQGSYDFQPNASSFVGDKSFRLNQMIQVLELMQGHPWINVPELDKEILDLMDLNNTKKIASKNPYVEGVQKGMQMAQEQMQEDAQKQTGEQSPQSTKETPNARPEKPA